MRTAEYLEQLGTVFESFLGHDSGNKSYGLNTPQGPKWVKVLDLRKTPLDDVHAVVSFYNSLKSELVPRSWSLIDLDDGPVMVHDWAPGTALRSVKEKRTDAGSTYQRFQRLRIDKRLSAFEQILDLFREIEEMGFIVEDFYDGCLIYDFSDDRLRVCDLDHIHRGPYVLSRDRQYGSSRFMAPEESRKGSRIDHRTNVYTMGATGYVLLNDNKRAAEDWPLPQPVHAVLEKAMSPSMADRQASVAELCREWKAAWR